MSLLLAAVGAASPAAPSGAPVLLWLGPFDTGSVDGPALLEAVAVYTRDLNLETRTASDIPLPSAAARAVGRDATAGAAIRAHGARLAFWCEPAPDGKTTTLTTVDVDGRLEARQVEAAGLDGAELNRAIALKLRAVLAATIGPEAVAAKPSAVPGAAAPPPAPTAPEPAPATPLSAPAAPPSPPPAAGAPVMVAAASPRPTVAPSRLFGVVGYRLSAPLGAGSFQQGAAGELGARLGRSVEVALGLAIETHATDGVGGETVSVFDLPIDVGARWMLRGPRLSWGAGGFAALHVLSASASASATASASAMATTSLDLGGSVGLVTLVRGKLAGTVAAEARLSGELAVPGTTYWVGQSQLVELGPRVSLNLGLVFPAF